VPEGSPRCLVFRGTGSVACAVSDFCIARPLTAGVQAPRRGFWPIRGLRTLRAATLPSCRSRHLRPTSFAWSACPKGQHSAVVASRILYESTGIPRRCRVVSSPVGRSDCPRRVLIARSPEMPLYRLASKRR
jgi:hypothetical protein